MPLTDLQRRFVDEYVVDFNATQAAIRAGYGGKHPGENVWELMQRPHVREAIEAKKAELSEKAGITAFRTLSEVANIAYADPRRVMSWAADGAVTLKDSEGLAPADAALISEIAQTKDGFRIKLHSKADALDKLMRHQGLYAPERLAVGGDSGAPPVEVRSDVDTARRIAFLLAKGVQGQASPAASKD